MTYVVDSDWVADWLAGRPQATRLLTDLSTDGIAISLVTYGEIYEGIYYGHGPIRAAQVFRQFLRDVPVIPLHRAILQRFARIRGDLRRRGLIIGDPDILIAATTIHYGHTLVTRNRRHSERLDSPHLRR
ncbi:MAG TPA: type II toxin-antitoxin system VapC family toxin [Dehalococcoidia bacterium]|nr:type II toxin-antitoxin system VapC family toxin [Dehalococcoidia bacterium]